MKKILFAFLMLLSLPLSAQTEESNHNFEVTKHLEIFNQLYKELDLYYVDTLSAEKNVENAINYMLSQIDPYTEYFSEQKTYELKQLTTGKYAGIGSVITVHQKEKRCIIEQPYQGMPAAEAGLMRGDIILAQDGVDYGLAEDGKYAEYSERVSSSLRGEPGTSFQLTVRRYGVPEPLTFTLTRRTVTLPSITYSGMLSDSVGYILLNTFTEKTSRDMRLAVAKLKQQGATSLILDLRGNGGGLMDQAVKVVNLFIPKGKEVVSLREKGGALPQTYKTEEEPLDLEIPLVVLVNSGTASSSEITSGALQDYDRAVIMGRRTYGKGLVQQPRRLPYNGVLKLTTAKYYIPSGRCIQAYRYKDGLPQHLPDSVAKEFHTAAGRSVRDGGGIKPDIELKADSSTILIDYLDQSDVLSDYVADYHNRHATIADPRSFHLTDAEYEAFKQFLKEKKFTYESRSKTTIDFLKKVVAAEGYGETVKAEMEALEQKLDNHLDHDLEYWEKNVREAVEQRIIEAYYYDEGVAEYQLGFDEDIKAAQQLLLDPSAYRKVLQP